MKPSACAGRRFPSAASGSGFSLLELVVVICVIAVLAAIGVERLARVRADAERAAVESFAAAVRSAVGIRVAASLAKGDMADIARLVGSNPVERLAEVPENYAGAYYGIDPELIERGFWYFDTRDRTLVYRVRFDEYFQTSLAGSARARYAVQAVYEKTSPAVGAGSAESRRLAGVRVAALESFRWTTQ